jgi:hypothetical protein
MTKKSNAGDITILDFKLYYRAIVTKAAWFWHKKRHEDQRDRIEDLEIKPPIFRHQTSDL